MACCSRQAIRFYCLGLDEKVHRPFLLSNNAQIRVSCRIKSTTLDHIRFHTRHRTCIISNCAESGLVENLVEKPTNLSNDAALLKTQEQMAIENTAHAKKPDYDDLSATTQQFTEPALAKRDGNGQNMLEQFRQIFMFAGPALGIWLSGPIMSLIDTSVVGTKSSLELAALGPGTVLCDGLSYVFMFLAVATSNLIATSLALKDEEEAGHHLSRLLFVSLVCGSAMLILTQLFSSYFLRAFVGAKNAMLIPAAGAYVKIRGLAWPAVLVGLVAQSASLGMQDSWGPLRVLAVAALINGAGDILLCTFMGYGIAGAAWATMFSQYVGTILLLLSLERRGYRTLAIYIPSISDLWKMLEIGAPVLLIMLSKVTFYSLITYLATSRQDMSLAAHQVMIGLFSLFAVWGEPLSQTAQSFIPRLIQGEEKSIEKAQDLFHTLLSMGSVLGILLGLAAVSIPWFMPRMFTKDTEIISQMRKISLPFFCGISITPAILSLEGTLLAGRDMAFLGLSMLSCLITGGMLLLCFHHFGFGLQGSWWVLVLFQSARFLQSYARLKSPKSVLLDQCSTPLKLQ